MIGTGSMRIDDCEGGDVSAGGLSAAGAAATHKEATTQRRLDDIHGRLRHFHNKRLLGEQRQRIPAFRERQRHAGSPPMTEHRAQIQQFASLPSNLERLASFFWRR
jgi:hypothetical protein